MKSAQWNMEWMWKEWRPIEIIITDKISIQNSVESNTQQNQVTTLDYSLSFIHLRLITRSGHLIDRCVTYQSYSIIYNQVMTAMKPAISCWTNEREPPLRCSPTVWLIIALTSRFFIFLNFFHKRLTTRTRTETQKAKVKIKYIMARWKCICTYIWKKKLVADWVVWFFLCNFFFVVIIFLVFSTRSSQVSV